MELRDTARVLAKLQIVDNRTVDEMTVVAWHEIIGGLEARDAIEAVVHHQRSSTDYVTPAHIMAAARAARSYRQAAERRDKAIEASAQGGQAARPAAYSASSLQARFPGEYRKGQAVGASTRAYHTTLRETGDQRAADKAKADTYSRIMADAPAPTVTPSFVPPSANDYVEPVAPDVTGDTVLGCPSCTRTVEVPADAVDPDSIMDDLIGHITSNHPGVSWQAMTITPKGA